MAFNNEDILTLAKAGFTAQQIAALNQVGGNAAPTAPASQPVAPTTPTQESVAAPAPAPATPPAPAPAPATPPATPPSTAAPHSVDDVLAAISGLSATIQNANLLSAQMPTEQKTAETVLASIINPPQKKEE